MSTEHGSPELLHVNIRLSRKVFSLLLIGLVLMISAPEGWAIRALTKKWMHLLISEVYVSEGVVNMDEKH
jgi:hypothetical protein